jgi:drug/metabolite transporter (DMT)-like permease
MRVAMLFLTALVPPLMWALSPLAVRMTHQAYDPYWAFALRSTLAACISLPVLYATRRRAFSWPQVLRAAQSSVLIYAAVFLSNLSFRYTTIGKAVFYASAYFLMVPLWKTIVYRYPLKRSAQLSLLLALLGLACISKFDLMVLNQGDVLGLASAVFSAAYMLLLDRSPQLTARPFTLNAIQCLCIAPLALLGANVYDQDTDLLPLVGAALQQGELTSPLLGILLLGCCVSWFSYSAQAYAQNRLPAHVVGVILLLDSPLACVGALVFLGEVPSAWTVCGGALIFAAALLMVAGAKPRNEAAARKEPSLLLV